MSATEIQILQEQEPATDDEIAIMDFGETDKAATEDIQTHTARMRRCKGRRFIRKHMRESLEDGDEHPCHFRRHHHGRKIMKREMKRWIRKMMWRQMALRMCYGTPAFGYRGMGCRRRRMMAAMMDSTSDDTSGGDSETGSRRFKRGRCGRRWERTARKTQNAENPTAEAEINHEKENLEQDANQTKIEKPAEGADDLQAAAVDWRDRGGIPRKKCGRGRWMRRRYMRRAHFYTSSDTSSSSDSSSDSSSSESESESEDGEKNAPEGRRRRVRIQREEAAEPKKDKGNKEKKHSKEKKSCKKGRKMEKKMMKKRGYFKRFY